MLSSRHHKAHVVSQVVLAVVLGLVTGSATSIDPVPLIDAYTSAYDTNVLFCDELCLTWKVTFSGGLQSEQDFPHCPKARSHFIDTFAEDVGRTMTA
ncbi:hypothetical protein HYH03_001838 [Edaphochlamys debaryana]|uniref:Uncharacterized protein n=1 Tax=Edaphochlamys debaryana TaxID=47281 RepID=A0A836C4W0_9CHLO|nr:hypothetical protein HYH03_001838 [Edaphochlamys debaryana]|eukprot:KAG2500260.1 hypothetical protein HYH03_001838 [Edaphochlamys debaryana]